MTSGHKKMIRLLKTQKILLQKPRKLKATSGQIKMKQLKCFMSVTKLLVSATST